MSNPNPKIPPSIEEKGGLEVHINEWALRLDNGKTYEDFVELMQSEIEPKTPNIMRVFKVSRLTAKKWITQYEKEKQNAK